MTSRDVAVYRTRSLGEAVPVGLIDTGVPILCDTQSIILEGDVSQVNGTGLSFEIELSTPRSLLVISHYTFNIVWSANRSYALAMTVATKPGGPPEGQSGNFQGPYSRSRITTLSDENNASITVSWGSVLARPAGTLSLIPYASLTTAAGRLAGVGSLFYVDCQVETDVVIGTFSDDECTQWGVSA